MLGAFAWFGKRGQMCLIAGLIAGLALPDLAEALRPWVATGVCLLLFVTGLRIGLRRALGSVAAIGDTLVRIAVFQTLLPLCTVGLFTALGLIHWPLSLAIVLMLAAPSLTGAPNFAVMMGNDPAPGMRLLILGTALFPLTALPVFLILDPTGGGPFAALSLSLGLLAAILLAVGAGFLVRRLLPVFARAPQQAALDGCAALLLGIVVVGLMSAVGPMLRANPGNLALWILTVFAVYLVLSIGTLFIMRRTGLNLVLPTSIYASNRNIALFLIVLPDAVAAPLMIYVGCYQIPMYLTPWLFSRLRAN